MGVGPAGLAADRNARLAARLRELGFDITLEEAEATRPRR